MKDTRADETGRGWTRTNGGWARLCNLGKSISKFMLMVFVTDFLVVKNQNIIGHYTAKDDNLPALNTGYSLQPKVLQNWSPHCLNVPASMSIF